MQHERSALRPRQQHVAHVVPSDNLVVKETVEAVGVVVANPALEEGAVVRRALTADVVLVADLSEMVRRKGELRVATTAAPRGCAPADTRISASRAPCRTDVRPC